MELWIRTQDKSRLIKVNSLQYEELRKTYYISGYCFNEVDSCVLGTYTTEKRALEILDEIQNEISKENLGYPNYTGIYEMPED